MTAAQRTIIGLAVALVVFVGALIGYRVWQDQQDPRDYPATVRDNFLVACAAASGGRSTDDVCRCTIDRLEEVYSLSEFTALERSSAQSGRVPRSYVDAIERCRGTYISPPVEGEGSATTPTSVDHSTSAANEDFPTAYADPEIGDYFTADDAQCSWELMRSQTVAYASGRGDHLTIEDRDTYALRTEFGCEWDWQPFGD